MCLREPWVFIILVGVYKYGSSYQWAEEGRDVVSKEGRLEGILEISEQMVLDLRNHVGGSSVEMLKFEKFKGGRYEFLFVYSVVKLVAIGGWIFVVDVVVRLSRRRLLVWNLKWKNVDKMVFRHPLPGRLCVRSEASRCSSRVLVFKVSRLFFSLVFLTSDSLSFPHLLIQK